MLDAPLIDSLFQLIIFPKVFVLELLRLKSAVFFLKSFDLKLSDRFAFISVNSSQ